MMRSERRGLSRTGVRGAALVAIALFSMLLVPALAAGTETKAPAPVNTEAPKLTGTPAVGQTLSCSTGVWANHPMSYSYTWLRNGAAISGQGGSTYVVQSADRGTSISCRVTAGNPGGSYTISGLPSGSYKVEFFADSEDGNYLEQYYNGKALIGEADAVTVTAPNVTSGINAELHPGGQISGRVIDSTTRAPIENIFVCADEAGGKHLFGGCSTTNSNGEYTIPGLQNGSYTVEFASFFLEKGYRIQYYNGKSSSGEAEAVGVTAGNTATGINAELHSVNEGGQISGTVTKASGGARIAGLHVCAYEVGGEEIFGGCTSTNANGEYTLSELAAANYRVEFSPNVCSGSGSCTPLNYVLQYYNGKPGYFEAESVAVSANKVTAGIDASMVEGGSVSGSVTSAESGALLANIEVCAEETGVEESSGCASTNSSGEYTIVGLKEGSYAIDFFTEEEGSNYLYQYYKNKAQVSEAEPVAVSAGKTTPGINAKLAQGGRIAGRATDASSHAGIAEVEVCAVEGDQERCAVTNANGEYTISGLVTGTYSVEFNADGEGLNYLSQTVAGVAAEAGQTHAGVNVEMHPGGEITGSIADASTHVEIATAEACAIATGFERCGSATMGTASVSATSNSLAIPAPNSAFTLAKAPVFESKTDDLVFFFKVANAGKFSWSLSFKNSDVGFASAVESSVGSVELALAEASKKKAKSKKCKAGEIKHDGKCVHATVPFSNGSQSVSSGTVEVKVHASSRAIKGLKAGHTLHVSGPFTFVSALGGSPVAHIESAAVKLPKPKKKSGKKHGKK